MIHKTVVMRQESIMSMLAVETELGSRCEEQGGAEKKSWENSPRLTALPDVRVVGQM